MTSAHAASARRRSPMAMMFADRDGRLRGNLIVAVCAAALMLLALGGTIAMLFRPVMSDSQLATWLLALFIFIKIPLLFLLWWVLGRRRNRGEVGGWDSEECGEILAYLEREARSSLGRPDAAKRLAYFSREAWFVAGNAAPADTAAAVATAERIDALASEAGIDTSRTRAEGAARRAD